LGTQAAKCGLSWLHRQQSVDSVGHTKNKVGRTQSVSNVDAFVTTGIVIGHTQMKAWTELYIMKTYREERMPLN